MKKILPLLIVLVVLVLLAALVFTANKRAPRQMDQRITLRQHDQIPYGTSVAKSLLPSLFPQASISYDLRSPGSWESVTGNSGNQLVILVCNYFNADKNELYELLHFVERGNYVFIIAKSFSEDAKEYLGITCSEYGMDHFMALLNDSLRVGLSSPPFNQAKQYFYPGYKYESWFYTWDSSRTAVLGTNDKGQADFIRLTRGSGTLLVHTAPLAFSNYFILHRNNYQYYQQVFSVIPPNIQRILWNEYYLVKPGNKEGGNKEPNWLGVLFRYPAFKWGLLTVLGTLLLLVILGMRRRQRMIPLRQKPANESLDFVKTMGRLYYDRKDHLNLSRKMGVYFLEYVRNTYKLQTQELDEQFIQALQNKSGHPEEQVQFIVNFIRSLQDDPVISEEELFRFHRQLESFYQNT